MTFIYVIICVIWIVRILNHYFKTEDEFHPAKYSCKKVAINPHLANSYKILEIDLNTSINPVIIQDAYSKQLVFATKNDTLGYKQNYYPQDFEAAKNYLIDYYNYLAYLN